jgi:hypothetical protein
LEVREEFTVCERGIGAHQVRHEFAAWTRGQGGNGDIFSRPGSKRDASRAKLRVSAESVQEPEAVQVVQALRRVPVTGAPPGVASAEFEIRADGAQPLARRATVPLLISK